jgi:hypothetical protein
MIRLPLRETEPIDLFLGSRRLTSEQASKMCGTYRAERKKWRRGGGVR